MLFESTHQHIPGNGWGYLWVGESDRGIGAQQPGGWIYQLLPHINQSNLRQIGSGMDAVTRRGKLGELTSRHVPILRCPSRPGSPTHKSNPLLVWWNADVVPRQSRTDYAINEGDFATNTDGGPSTLAGGDDASFAWTDVRKATGVSFLRSMIRLSDIADGTSSTYLIGEKLVSCSHYDDYADPGYDQHPFGGVDLDLNRWTYFPPIKDDVRIDPRSFGSSHTGGCHMSFCDASVRVISYNVDATVHRRLGHRADGGPAGSVHD